MSLLTKHKWLNIVYGVLLIVIGALTLTFAIVNVDVVNQVISISLAVSLFIAGILNIASSIIAHTEKLFTSTLLVGSFAIAFGIVLLVNRTLIGSFIALLLGTFLLALGTVYLVKAIIFIILKQKVPAIILMFVIAAIAIGLGVTVVCFQQESQMVLYAFIGVSFAVMGVIELILVVRDLLEEKKKAKEEEQPAEFQDVEVINKEDPEAEVLEEPDEEHPQIEHNSDKIEGPKE